jgi:hypothetical protein
VAIDDPRAGVKAPTPARARAERRAPRPHQRAPGGIAPRLSNSACADLLGDLTLDRQRQGHEVAEVLRRLRRPDLVEELAVTDRDDDAVLDREVGPRRPVAFVVLIAERTSPATLSPRVSLFFDRLHKVEELRALGIRALRQWNERSRPARHRWEQIVGSRGSAGDRPKSETASAAVGLGDLECERTTAGSGMLTRLG